MAIAVTLAALAALAIAAHNEAATSVKKVGPVTRVPVEQQSAILPVVDR